MTESQEDTMKKLIKAGPELIEVCKAMADLLEEPEDWPDELFVAHVQVEDIRKAHRALRELRGT